MVGQSDNLPLNPSYYIEDCWISSNIGHCHSEPKLKNSIRKLFRINKSYFPSNIVLDFTDMYGLCLKKQDQIFKDEICKKCFNFQMIILILDHSGYVAAS